jgi:mRNA interferase MazF
VKRGEVWWSWLPERNGSSPAYRRPVLIVQADAYNDSGIRTVIVATLTSNTRLAEAPGNVLVRSRGTQLPQDSVVNVTQLIAVDRSFFTEFIDELPHRLMEQVDVGLRLVRDLPD